MKKIFSNKKIILIILSVILLLILLSTYIKTKEIKLFSFFDNQEIKEEKFFFNEKESEKTRKNNLELTKISAKKSNKKLDKIESIALISEIKDPFVQREKANKSTSKNNNQDLIFLEKNIISKELNLSDQNESKNLLKSEKKAAKNRDLKEKKTELDKNIKIPFQLLGIIKNKDNSTVILNYQGKNYFKKENEKIDLFIIEKINKNNISLSYKNKIKTINLWEKGENED